MVRRNKINKKRNPDIEPRKLEKKNELKIQARFTRIKTDIKA